MKELRIAIAFLTATSGIIFGFPIGPELRHCPAMNLRMIRAGALLAINLVFLNVWGFAGISKVINGMPSWFPGKFGKTFLATFPGLAVTFWVLALSELLALTLGLVALGRMEFMPRKPAIFLQAMLAWSLFVFVQLGFGQWLTNDFNGAFQQFMYFSGTLVALQFVTPRHDPEVPIREGKGDIIMRSM